MKTSFLLCISSALAALVGLLVLVLGMRRRRWRFLWVLVTAAFLIGAGFGAAETVYQFAIERDEEQRTETHLSNPTQALPMVPTATMEPTATQTPPPTATPTSTATPAPKPTLTEIACVYGVELVQIRSPLEHWYVNSRPAFELVLRNNGSCSWPDDARLVLVSEPIPGLQESWDIGPVDIDKTIEIEIEFRASSTAQTIRLAWQLEGDGQPIGDEITYDLRVELRPTPTATRTPTVTQTSTSPLPTPQPTAELRPSPTLRATPETADVLPSTSGDVDILAPSLIPAEREILTTLDDPPHYILNVTVDFDALTVAGTAEIHYTNNERDILDAIYLRLYPNAEHYEEGETQIDSVSVDGVAADFSFEDTARTILKVPLSAPLAPDERTKLEIAFAVTVPRRSDRFGYEEGVMSLGHWYPMLAVYDDEGWNLDPYVALGDAFYSDVAFFTVDLTVPEGMVLAATGVEAGQVLRRPQSMMTVYVSGATRDFALALSREYQTVSTQIEETMVTSYYLPGHEQAGRQALQVAADALKVYSTRFGRYPYTELDVAETSFSVLGGPGGMEFPGVVFIGSEFYQPQGLFASDLDVVVAHEVAHQWWYGVVGNNQVDEPWLDEAFATYSSILYFEDKQGAAAAEAIFWSQAVLPYQFARMLGEDGPLQSSLLDYSSDLITYQSIVYGKGALFLARLRELLGDDAFFAVLQHHYQAHKYDLLTPGDFRRSIEEALEDDQIGATKLAEALALYDAVVVRGEPIEGITGLDGLEGLLGGDLSPEDVDDLMRLLEQLLQSLEP